MDPMTVALIFAGIRLATQAMEGSIRAKMRLTEFEAYLLALHTEGREPTLEEIGRFVQTALEADDGLSAAIQRLKDAAGNG